MNETNPTGIRTRFFIPRCYLLPHLYIHDCKSREKTLIYFFPKGICRKSNTRVSAGISSQYVNCTFHADKHFVTHPQTDIFVYETILPSSFSCDMRHYLFGHWTAPSKLPYLKRYEIQGHTFKKSQIPYNFNKYLGKPL